MRRREFLGLLGLAPAAPALARIAAPAAPLAAGNLLLADLSPASVPCSAIVDSTITAAKIAVLELTPIGVAE
jgi:hypothetical protein